MSDALQIYRRAQSLGLRLEPDGSDLLVRPGSKCPPDFAAVLRQHKRELLVWLETRAVPLAPDCLPWLHIARQVLAGEFEGADKSTRDSFNIGLRSIQHPAAAQALARLKEQERKYGL